MNETLKFLTTRRTVRDFQKKQLDDQDIELILQAGIHASSAMNRQSWHFAVVQDAELLDAISGAVGEVLVDSEIPSLIERARSTGFSSFHHAPTVIFVCGEGTHYSNADCANASQNLCNAAASLGIGSCYIGSFVKAFEHPAGKGLLEKFNLPQDLKPVFAVALGYSNSEVLYEKEKAWKVSYIR